MAATSALGPRRTLVDETLRGRGVAYQLGLVVAGSLLLALLAQISFRLPFTPVPITGQTYGVLLVGAVLGSRRGALSVLLYLVEGGLGLPVFAGGASGGLIGPTGGYLGGFVLAAYLVGWLAERGWDRSLRRAVIAMILGQAAIYLIGVTWLAVYVGAERAVPLGLLPFLAGDVLKILLAATTLPAAWRLVGKVDARR